MRKTITPLIVLTQMVFLTAFIIDTMAGSYVIRFMNAPLTIILVLISNIVLFANSWVINREESRRKIMETETILHDEFHSLVSSVRSDRHDMNNHLTVISGLIKLNRNDRANEYIQKLIGDISINNQILQITDPVLASLIFAGYSKFNAANIRFDVEITSSLISEKLSMTDLVRLISNTLDNAFEEVVKHFGEDRKISISIKEDSRNVYLKVINPTSATKFDDSWLLMNGSSHGEKGQRGYGLSIIQDVVNRHQGSVKFEVIQGEFIVQVTFPKVGQ